MVVKVSLNSDDLGISCHNAEPLHKQSMTTPVTNIRTVRKGYSKNFPFTSPFKMLVAEVSWPSLSLDGISQQIFNPLLSDLSAGQTLRAMVSV